MHGHAVSQRPPARATRTTDDSRGCLLSLPDLPATSQPVSIIGSRIFGMLWHLTRRSPADRDCFEDGLRAHVRAVRVVERHRADEERVRVVARHGGGHDTAGGGPSIEGYGQRRIIVRPDHRLGLTPPVRPHTRPSPLGRATAEVPGGEGRAVASARAGRDRRAGQRKRASKGIMEHGAGEGAGRAGGR
jgi:hypothetical protein